MPKEKSPYTTGIEALIKDLNQARASIIHIKGLSEAERVALDKPFNTIIRKIGQYADTDELDKDGIKDLSDAIKLFDTAIDDYINQNSGNQLPKSKREAADVLKTVKSKFDDNSSVKGLISANEYLTEFTNGDGTKGKAQYDKYGIEGTQPSFEDCRTMTFNNPDRDKSFGQLLWLIDKDYKSQRLRPGISSYYKKTIDRLQDELEKTDFETQMDFGIKLNRHLNALYEATYKKFNELKDNAPQGADRHDYAMRNIADTPEYQSCEALSFFISVTRETDCMKITDLIARSGKDIDASMANKEASKFVSGLINNGLKSYLTEHELITHKNGEKTIYEIEHVDPELNRLHFYDTQKRENILQDYEKLVKDPEKKSQSCQDMEKGIRELLSAEISDANYANKIRAAKDYINAYLDSHKGYRFSDNGKERVRIANSLLASVNEIEAEYIKITDHSFDPKDVIWETGCTARTIESQFKAAKEKGLSPDEFTEAMMGPIRAGNIEDVEAKLKEYGTNVQKIDENDIPPLEQYTKAQQNYIKTTAEIADIFYSRDKALYYREIDNDKKIGLVNDRDLAHFVLDYGRDAKTLRANMDKLALLAGTNFNVNITGKKDQLLKDQAALYESRIAKFEAIDFDKYYDISDKDLVDNYSEIMHNMFAVSVFQNVTKTISNNPYVSQQLLDRMTALENKYSNLMAVNRLRMELIANPYSRILDINQMRMSTPTDALVLFSSADKTDVEFQNFASTLHDFTMQRDNAIADHIRAQMCSEPGDNEAWKRIEFYDSNGERISFEIQSLYEKIRDGGRVYAIDPKNPVLKCFDTKGKPIEKYALGVDQTIQKKLRDVIRKHNEELDKAEEEYQQLCEDTLNRINEHPVYIDNMNTDLKKNLQTLRTPAFSEVFDKVAIGKNELAKGPFINAIMEGKTLYDIEKLPEAKKITRQELKALYEAGHKDFLHKDQFDSKISETAQKIKIQVTDGEEIKRVSTENQLQTLSEEDAKKIKELHELTMNNSLENAIRISLIPQTSHRCFLAFSSNPGLSPEEQKNISEKSFSFEGRQELCSNIIDELLSLDPADFANITYEEYQKDYQRYEYIRGIAFDYTYVEQFKHETEGIFTIKEFGMYKKYVESISTNLNRLHKYADCYSYDNCDIVDVSKITGDNAFIAASKTTGNNAAYFLDIFQAKDNDTMAENVKLTLEETHDAILQNRWTKALLSKPKMSEDTRLKLGLCNIKANNPDGRNAIYELAIEEIIAMGDKDLSTASNEEKAYCKLLAQASKYLEKQMKRDKFELAPEKLKHMKEASEKLKAVKADVKDSAKTYDSNSKQAKNEAEALIRKATKGSLVSKADQCLDSAKKALEDDNQEALINSLTGMVYYEISSRVKNDEDVQKLEALDSEKAHKIIATEMKSNVSKFLKEIPNKELEKMIGDKDFKKEFVHAYSYFQQSINPEFKGKDFRETLMNKLEAKIQQPEAQPQKEQVQAPAIK